MSVTNLVPQEDATREYHNVLRGLVSESYQHLSGEELEHAVEQALVQLPEEEAEEIFGVLAGIATSAASGFIKKAGKRLIRRVVRRGGRRVISRVRRFSNRIRRRIPRNKSMLYLMRMIRNPQFLSSLAGNYLNRRTGGRIAKSVVRTVVKKAGRTETVELSLESYLNAIGYLAKQAGQDGAIGQEASFLNSSDVDVDQAENTIAQLYGEELHASDDHGEESWYGDDTEAGDYYGSYQGENDNQHSEVNGLASVDYIAY